MNLLIWTAACQGPLALSTSTGADLDADGVDASTDCDDHDPAVGGPVPGFADLDGDGYPGTFSTGCGLAASSTDCDDDHAEVHPGGSEVTCNGLDDDCAPASADGPVFDGDLAFATLADAVGSAAEGDVLQICPGAYREGVTVDRGLTIEALATDPAVTVIGGVDGPIVTWAAEAGTLTLRDLTVAGADGDPNLYDHGAIVGSGAGALVLEGCVVRDGAGVDGGGIYATGPLTLSDTVVTSNFAQWSGGGVDGAGPVVLSGATKIEDNATDGGGGGLFLRHSLIVDGPDVVVSGNTAVGGAGLWLESAQAPSDVGDLRVTGNVASSRGGGAVVMYADWSGGTFTYNVSDEGEGGGLQITFANLSDAVVEDNVSGDHGGGIAAENSTLTAVEIRRNAAVLGAGLANINANSNTLVDCVVEDNVASDRGGGLYSYEWLHTPWVTLTVSGGSISGNTAGNGGGGIWSSGSLALDGVALDGNQATDGGAVVVDPINPGDLATLDASFSGNTASRWGGAVYVGSLGAVTLTGADVLGNGASSGGGAALATGASLSSTASAWSDDAPDDVALLGASVSYAAPAGGTFSCGGGACTP